MSDIEEKCKQKGVRLTEQRRIIAKIMSESKLTFGSKIIQMSMNYIKESL